MHESLYKNHTNTLKTRFHCILLNVSHFPCREKTGSSKRRFSVLVSSADCPDSNEEILITEGVRGGLPCKQTEIFSLNVTRRVRWMKVITSESTYVGEDGFLRLPAVTDRDAGKYTCIINVIMNGTSYTAARSIQLTVRNADLSDFYLSMILFLSASLVILVLAVSFYCLKVDLVLAYRKLLRHFSTQDGKLYDAYVSVVQSDVWCLCEAERFALQVLPEELEQKHGYSLFIRGRDDSPGEAVHDVIATTLHQCRRLIIILSPDIRKVETELLHENQNQLWFELNLGLHDALLRNDPKVILVEVDGPVDYCNLPESLCFIKRKQGALKWKNKFCGANQTTTYSKSVFWKKLRYCMPAVGTGNIQSAA
uniref:Interleukin 1 receptor-like 2 n=1 Tax=Nothobranchius furzeri TaxID=105023 RepID=A0A8C6LGN7_NOTFU